MKIITAFLCVMLMGCSISFQNLDTHGESSDLIDENQTVDPVLTPKLSKHKHKKDVEDKFIKYLV